MTETTWTPEQEEVLASDARLLLVRAGPGSGKTRVFVELLRQRLVNWGNRRGGVAALSFTNVAHDEIVKRLGGSVGGPHFTGTLDAFFFRFVIAPFAHVLKIPAVRLIPSPLNREMRGPYCDFPSASGVPNKVPVLHIDPVSGTEREPRFRRLRVYGEGTEPVDAALTKAVITAKANEWRSGGRINHADCHYLAACILRSPQAGAVLKLLVKRFPVILVDELQDTGHFLSRALLPLLGEESLRAVVVGDEDQRIFGFAGADPALFRAIEAIHGCKAFALTVTHRCQRHISRVAMTLSRSGRPIASRHDAVDGRAVLCVHDGQAENGCPTILREALAHCEAQGCKSVAILVRTREEVRAIMGLTGDKDAKLSSKGAKSLDRAEKQLLDGRGDIAAKIAESIVGHVLMDAPAPTRAELTAMNVDPWRFAVHARALVLKSVAAASGKTWGVWKDIAKDQIELAVRALGGTEFKGRLGGLFKKGQGDRPEALRPLPVAARLISDKMKVEVLTVHKAKGREFDGVCFYVPEPKEARDCPSESWWASGESEEREVAFVAVSRARMIIVACLHRKTFEALEARRPEHVAAFSSTVIPPRPQAMAEPKKRKRGRAKS